MPCKKFSDPQCNIYIYLIPLYRMSTATMEDSMQQNKDNNVELYAAGQEALVLLRTSRKTNTKKNYDPKQKEWEVSVH